MSLSVENIVPKYSESRTSELGCRLKICANDTVFRLQPLVTIITLENYYKRKLNNEKAHFIKYYDIVVDAYYYYKTIVFILHFPFDTNHKIL